MPIAFPDQPPATDTPAQGAGPAARRPDERDRTRPRTGARDVNAEPEKNNPPAEETPTDSEPERTGELVIFPGGELVPSSAKDAALEWWAEARQTASRALDGSVYRARPPAIRDSFERLKRAEWSGGITALRWAGWVYGYPAQGLRALLMVLIWLLDHPSRLLVAASVLAAAFYLS